MDKKGKLGDWIDKFEKCISEDDFKEFYKEYWVIVEDAIVEEENIKIGDTRPFAKTYERVRSNINYLIDKSSEMRGDYAKKVFWFLYF